MREDYLTQRSRHSLTRYPSLPGGGPLTEDRPLPPARLEVDRDEIAGHAHLVEANAADVRYLGVDAETAYREWKDLGFSNGFLRALDSFFKESTAFEDVNHIQSAPSGPRALNCKKVAI